MFTDTFRHVIHMRCASFLDESMINCPQFTMLPGSGQGVRITFLTNSYYASSEAIALILLSRNPMIMAPK